MFVCVSKSDNPVLGVHKHIWVRCPRNACPHACLSQIPPYCMSSCMSKVIYHRAACPHVCLSQITPCCMSACVSKSDTPNAMMKKQGVSHTKGLPKQWQQIPRCLYYLAWLVLEEPHPTRKHLLLVLIYYLLLSHFLGSFAWQHGFSYFQFSEKLSHHIWGYSASFISTCKVFSIAYLTKSIMKWNLHLTHIVWGQFFHENCFQL